MHRIYYATIILIGLASCSSSAMDSPDSDVMKKILSFGEVVELNSLNQEVEKNLYLRLYSLPSDNSECHLETHITCKYQYFLSISTFDEKPEFNIITLPFQGEIAKIEWVNMDSIDSASIRFELNNFTKPAFKANDQLKNNYTTLQFQITPARIKQVN